MLIGLPRVWRLMQVDDLSSSNAWTIAVAEE